MSTEAKLLLLDRTDRTDRGPRVADLTDEGLVAACATGDRAARALLFERHVDTVHRFVARMRASDPDTVDDLVQATFVSAFESGDATADYDGDGFVTGADFDAYVVEFEEGC